MKLNLHSITWWQLIGPLLPAVASCEKGLGAGQPLTSIRLRVTRGIDDWQIDASATDRYVGVQTSVVPGTGAVQPGNSDGDVWEAVLPAQAARLAAPKRLADRRHQIASVEWLEHGVTVHIYNTATDATSTAEVPLPDGKYDGVPWDMFTAWQQGDGSEQIQFDCGLLRLLCDCAKAVAHRPAVRLVNLGDRLTPTRALLLDTAMESDRSVVARAVIQPMRMQDLS